MKQETFEKHAREVGHVIVNSAFDYADQRLTAGEKVAYGALVLGPLWELR